MRRRRRSPDPTAVGAGHLPPKARVPADLTATTFARVRRGVDPRQVAELLHRIAVDMAARDRQLAALVDENQRLKTALTTWQSGIAPIPSDDGYQHQPPPSATSTPSALPRRPPTAAQAWDLPTAAHPARHLPPRPEL